MPYVDKDRQKEFQRLWARNRKDKRYRNLSLRKDVITNSDGTLNISRRVVTWGELNKLDLKKIHTWKECTLKAKSIIIGRKTNKIHVAALAIRACEIKHGGDRRTEDSKEKIKTSLKAFSKDIGINHSTLWNWVKIKTMIIDKLEPMKTIDFSAARNALDHVSKHGGSVKAAYSKFINEDPFDNRGRMLNRYLKNSFAILNTYGTQHFSKDALKEARITNSHIREKLGV